MSHDPIAYAYEAAHHCPSCTRYAFSTGRPNGIEPEEALDSDGNPVRAVFSWDEWWEPSLPGRQVLVCDTCGDEIDEREVEVPEERSYIYRGIE